MKPSNHLIAMSLNTIFDSKPSSNKDIVPPEIIRKSLVFWCFRGGGGIEM